MCVCVYIYIDTQFTCFTSTKVQILTEVGDADGRSAESGDTRACGCDAPESHGSNHGERSQSRAGGHSPHPHSPPLHPGTSLRPHTLLA